MITVALTPDQLRACIRACKDQALFHTHAAQQEEFTGFTAFAADDYAQAAYLTALAEQLEDLTRASDKKIA